MEKYIDSRRPYDVGLHTLILSILPKCSLSQIMGYLKRKSVKMIFERHSNLGYKYSNRQFWIEIYYVSTVDLNIATIQKYIR